MFLPLLLVAATPAPAIIDRPIRFDAEREQAMLEYRRRHQDRGAKDLTIEPRVIVLHHTAVAPLARAFATFDRTWLPESRRELAKEGRVNVSAHFLIDRDGTIYRLMPETRMARHCIGLNHVAIGVENVGGDAGHPLTRAQVEASAALVRALVARHPITHLVGHHEARRMEHHPYFRETSAGYRTAKIDPGDAFMASVRHKLSDLHLSGPP